MSVKLALVLVGVSVGMLAVYGSDVVLNIATGEGYLPFDQTVRGYGLGVPSLILPITAYFISRKEPSTTLGSLIVASGALIIIGGITILFRTDVASSPIMVLSESVPLLVIGGYIAFLGTRKFASRVSPQMTR